MPCSMIDTVIQGDCMDVMAGMPDNSVDSIITDPPYGLGFMGKDWDTFTDAKKSQRQGEFYTTRNIGGQEVKHTKGWSAASSAGLYDHSRNREFQAWFTVWAKECLRVAKPGAILMAFGGTRTYHRLTCAIEDAGWQIRDDISNLIGGNWKMEAFYESLDPEQQGAFAELFLPANHLQWIYGSGFPKSLDISKAIDKAAGAEREVVGSYRAATQTNQCGTSFNASKANEQGQTVANITIPATPLAQLWSGWGTALKPSWEPIIVAMKPLDGTFAENAEKWGVAGLNIDGGRIEYQSDADKKSSLVGFKDGQIQDTNVNFLASPLKKAKDISEISKGRFPSNTILDESAAVLLDEQSGELQSGALKPYKENHTNASSYQFHRDKTFTQDANSGGASRFFYCAKASRAERNAGCEGMEAGKSYKMRTANSEDDGWGKKFDTVPQQNHHPTVKPLALMEYLCNLTKTPTGGIVLDPFAGSGTTGLAAYRTNRQYILIEKEEEYAEIARARLKAEKGQYALFGADA